MPYCLELSHSKHSHSHGSKWSSHYAWCQRDESERRDRSKRCNYIDSSAVAAVRGASIWDVYTEVGGGQGLPLICRRTVLHTMKWGLGKRNPRCLWTSYKEATRATAIHQFKDHFRCRGGGGWGGGGERGGGRNSQREAKLELPSTGHCSEFCNALRDSKKTFTDHTV